MNLEVLRKKVREEIENHPDLQEVIMDFYELALDEIDNGASETQESKIAWESIDQLITEDE